MHTLTPQHRPDGFDTEDETNGMQNIPNDNDSGFAGMEGGNAPSTPAVSDDASMEVPPDTASLGNPYFTADVEENEVSESRMNVDLAGDEKPKKKVSRPRRKKKAAPKKKAKKAAKKPMKKMKKAKTKKVSKAKAGRSSASKRSKAKKAPKRSAKKAKKSTKKTKKPAKKMPKGKKSRR